jgi:hypothetical protein
MKVGDLVRFHYDHRWTGATSDWGLGLIEKSYNNGTFEVVWPQANWASRTLGPKCLELISESR